MQHPYDYDSLAVRQANTLAKSGQELDLIEKRLLLVAMSRVTKGDTELLTHRISVTELAPFFGGDPWRAANKAAMGLLNRVVYIEGEAGGFTAFQWTTLARYVPASRSEDGSSYLEIRLNEELAPYLLELKERFNVIPLLELLPMGSVNSQRLYEILWHDSFRARKPFITYDLEKLRFQLGLRAKKIVKGKEAWVEKYASWRDFQKVLKRAQLDFADHGSLSFEYEGLSQGRTTTQVRFHIERKDAGELAAPHDPELAARQRDLAARLEAAGYTQDALGAVETHGLDVAETALKLARDAERAGARSARPIHNVGGLIHHLLKTGLARRRLEGAAEDAPPQSAARGLAQALLDAYAAARQAFADDLWATLTPESQQGFPGLMRLELSPIELAQLDKGGWEGAGFESSKRKVLLLLYADEVPDELGGVRAFAEHDGWLRDLDDATAVAVLAECEAHGA